MDDLQPLEKAEGDCTAALKEALKAGVEKDQLEEMLVALATDMRFGKLDD